MGAARAANWPGLEGLAVAGILPFAEPVEAGAMTLNRPDTEPVAGTTRVGLGMAIVFKAVVKRGAP